jgi:hypothetical protein
MGQLWRRLEGWAAFGLRRQLTEERRVGMGNGLPEKGMDQIEEMMGKHLVK